MILAIDRRGVALSPADVRDPEVASTSSCFRTGLKRLEPMILANLLLAVIPYHMMELAKDPDIDIEKLTRSKCKVGLNKTRLGVYLDVLAQRNGRSAPEPYTGRAARAIGGLSARAVDYHWQHLKKICRCPLSHSESHQKEVASGRKPHLLVLAVFPRETSGAHVLSSIGEIAWCMLFGTMTNTVGTGGRFDDPTSRKLWNERCAETSDQLPSLPGLNLANPVDQPFSDGKGLRLCSMLRSWRETRRRRWHPVSMPTLYHQGIATLHRRGRQAVPP